MIPNSPLRTSNNLEERFNLLRVDGMNLQYRGQGIMSGDAFKSTIVEEVEMLSREPKLGLFPADFDEESFNQKRLSIAFTQYVPKKFQPQLAPLKRLEFYTKAETATKPEDLARQDNMSVQLINISSSSFDIRYLNRFVNCQILALKNCGIVTLKNIILPNLRICNLSDNQITNHMEIVPFLANSKNIQHLVVKGNPFEKLWPDWKHSVLCSCLDLISLNDLPVTIVEKQTAIEKKGTVQQQQKFGYMKWDWLISFLCDKMGITTWLPEKFKNLNLRQAKLREFHVGVFPFLKKLDVSNNEIRLLWRCGLERCSNLQEIDISNNLISDVDCLKVLHFIPNLQKVEARGNQLPEDYELHIIYYTSSLKGTNRTPGLVMLNGKDITIEERAEAAKKFGNKRVEELKWYYSIINTYGHYQLRHIPNFSKRVKILEITNRKNVTIADLSGFESLEFINLSNNDLIELVGLSGLKNLKYVDVQLNPRLDKERVVESLSTLTNLRQVVIGSYNEKLMSPSNTNLLTNPRIEVLLQLLRKNNRLIALDNQEISLEERCTANPNSRMSVLESYRSKFYLAIVYQSVPTYDRVFTDKMIKPSSGLYNPSNITVLTFSGLKLKDSSIDFELFVNLIKLDLSDNNLKSILGIKLERCVKLEILDVSGNKINDTQKEVADLINIFPNLQTAILKGNPFLGSAKELQILKYLKKEIKHKVVL